MLLWRENLLVAATDIWGGISGLCHADTEEKEQTNEMQEQETTVKCSIITELFFVIKFVPFWNEIIPPRIKIFFYMINKQNLYKDNNKILF